MAVDFEREEYRKALPRWQLVDDVCAASVKDGGMTYLPMPNPDDVSAANKKRYEQYKARAVFYNATGRTLAGLVGAVFRKAPQLSIPAGLDYVRTDIDGCGVSIFQQSRRVLGKVMRRGRHGLLVDYPAVDGSVSRAAQSAGLIRSTVVSVDAQSIVNWRTTKIGGIHRLSLVVLKESATQIDDDGFGLKSIDQYRVLKLEEGRYVVEIWRKVKAENGREDWAIVETYSPIDGAGRPWEEIPFEFIGAENNDSDVDESPLYDLASLNVAHYRNSADYEDSAFFVGQAQPVISGLTEEWRDELEKSGVYIGSRTPITLPEGGDFKFAQAQPNTLVKEAMDQKERQMVALGARLIERGQAVKTATEAQAENEAEHSVVSLVASNVSEAYTNVLKWMARFENVSDSGIEYELSQDLAIHSLDAQMLTALVSAWQSGAMPKLDLIGNLRRHGLVDPEKTDEEILEELEADSPGLNLGDE